MEPRKNSSGPKEPKITDAAEKTGLLIRQLQSRLSRAGGEEPDGSLSRELQSRLAAGDVRAGVLLRELESRRGSASAPSEPVEETPEDMEKQMQEYFERAGGGSSTPSDAAGLRARVVEEAADRILREWGADSSLEDEVVERIVERVLERLAAGKPTARGAHS